MIRKILDSIFSFLVMASIDVKYTFLKFFGLWPKICEECNYNYVEDGHKTCPGCDAYREHQN